MDENRPTALLLLGPTASGKSAFAMRLADALPLEIVSVDSAQVYRGLDIGTAKPDAADRTRVAHHLIDIREPNQTYSAADFVCDASQAIGEIRARGRLPLLVGGTMLYAKSLLDGLNELPSADPVLRSQLAQQASDSGWPALHARLATLDPATAERLEPNDSQRIQRALEICLLSGEPMSALLSRPRSTTGTALRVLRLMPADRGELHRRIEQRLISMIERGFLDEVRGLRARGDLSPQSPSMRSVGYRQAWQLLDGITTEEEFRAAAVAATRQLAKRQLTWLRSMEDAPAIDPLDVAAYSAIESTARSIANG